MSAASAEPGAAAIELQGGSRCTPPAQGSFPLHWPLVNSEHLREKLGRRELDRKRIEDSEKLQLQDPNFRRGGPAARWARRAVRRASAEGYLAPPCEIACSAWPGPCKGKPALKRSFRHLWTSCRVPPEPQPAPPPPLALPRAAGPRRS